MRRAQQEGDVGDDETVVEGGRNHYLHTIGAKYRRENGYPEWKLFGLLQAHNFKQCKPPLDTDEVRRIARNCAEYEYTPPLDLSEWTKDEVPPIPEGGDLAISLFDLVTNPPDPPVPLVNGVISVGTGVLIAGQPNVGKSWMVMDMALAVASGEAWLDSYPSTQGPVLMIDEEGTQYGQYERFQMLLDGRSNMSAAGLPLNVAIGSGIRLDTDVGITRVRRMLERYKPRLVVIDSLVRMHSGEENNAQNMSKFFDTTKGLMRTYDATFLFTHHVRKPSLDSADPGDLIRGTTEIRAWPDTIFVITPGEDSQEVIFHHVKSRYSRRSDPFRVAMQIDEDSGTARFVHNGDVEPNDNSVITQHNKVLRAISDITESGADADIQSIADRVDRTARTVKVHLEKLARIGAIDVMEMSIGGSKTIHVYRIKGA